MKYGDLIQFDPINEVVIFDRLTDSDYRRSLVRNFVFSPVYEQTFIPLICRNLDFTATHDTFGLQIVGNYGTGKSHLMSLFSLIAEDAELLPLVANEKAQRVLANIAGRYRVVRFELGSDDDLWRLVCYQIDRRLKEWGIDYRIADDQTPDSYTDKLARLMAAFEQHCPEQGLMVVIDEMLSYLKSRTHDAANLNRDLMVLQALGQMSNHSRLRMVYGVQELIYQVSDFQFAREMLGRVSDRYRQVTITRQDVAYVVQRRLLRKTDEQREAVRRHLSPFASLFTDLHAHFDDYVELFPVHPSFFDNFQQIRVGKSQREVLKTLSRRFATMLDREVPTQQPGLICYDHYWQDLDTPDMRSGDLRTVSEVVATVHQKITESFTGGRAARAPLAHRIADAAAIKILQQDLTHTNGATAETLADDLMYVPQDCETREWLIDVVADAANLIVKATIGQYFEKNEKNQEYHLRVEGGVNYEERVKAFADTMTADTKDQYFYQFLAEQLALRDAYRPTFKIYRHRIEWAAHRSMVEGYIFMGTPRERSTTHPELNFYIYLLPLFNAERAAYGQEPDSVYFSFAHFTPVLRRALELYAAASAQRDSADTTQKQFYSVYVEQYQNELRPLFKREFMQATEVYYQGQLQSLTPDTLPSTSALDTVNSIVAQLLGPYLDDLRRDYPRFDLLTQPLGPDTRAALLRAARQRIARREPNRAGEAILSGLGLLTEQQLSHEASIYARSVLQRLEEKGEGQVVNRDELLRQFSDAPQFASLWVTRDYGLEADLEFVVLLALVSLGYIEIDLPGGRTYNAANLADAVKMADDDAYTFTHIRRPKDINTALVRTLFMGVVGRDLTAQLGESATYATLTSEARAMAGRITDFAQRVRGGVTLGAAAVVTADEAQRLSTRITALCGILDRMPAYRSEAQLRHLPKEWTAEAISERFKVLTRIQELEDNMRAADELRPLVDYLHQALNFSTDARWKQRAHEAEDCLPDLVRHISEAPRVQEFKARLEALKRDYIQWYADVYNACHLDGIQEAQKRAIAESDDYKIYETISRADNEAHIIPPTEQYAEWNSRFVQWQLGQSEPVTRTLEREPCVAGFNPVAHAGTTMPSLNQLKEELEAHVTAIDKAMRGLIADSYPKNKSNLNADDQRLSEWYVSESEPLTPLNAERLYRTLERLQQDIKRIKVSAKELQRRFGTPMTARELIDGLRRYIKDRMGSNPEDTTRISIGG